MDPILERSAVIDCGTNTFNLLIADQASYPYNRIFKTREEVKLNREALPDGTLPPAAIARACKALKKLKQLAQDYQASQLVAVATAAFRNAPNQQEVLDQILQETGIQVLVISGHEEAKHIHAGVQMAVPAESRPSLIMDIGGGSTEFILTVDHQIQWMESFPLGAARLINTIQPEDPISPYNQAQLHQLLEKELVPLLEATAPLSNINLIGSSGSFDSLADIHFTEDTGAPMPRSHYYYRFELDRTIRTCEHLITLDYQQRLATPGIIPMRADMIGMACSLLLFVLKKVPVSDLSLSTLALKEGVVFNLLRFGTEFYTKSLI